MFISLYRYSVFASRKINLAFISLGLENTETILIKDCSFTSIPIQRINCVDSCLIVLFQWIREERIGKRKSVFFSRRVQGKRGLFYISIINGFLWWAFFYMIRFNFLHQYWVLSNKRLNYRRGQIKWDIYFNGA